MKRASHLDEAACACSFLVLSGLRCSVSSTTDPLSVTSCTKSSGASLMASVTWRMADSSSTHTWHRTSASNTCGVMPASRVTRQTHWLPGSNRPDLRGEQSVGEKGVGLRERQSRRKTGGAFRQNTTIASWTRQQDLVCLVRHAPRCDGEPGLDRASGTCNDRRLAAVNPQIPGERHWVLARVGHHNDAPSDALRSKSWKH